MNGPEHYREAERLLAGTDDPEFANRSESGGATGAQFLAVREQLIAQAQVHATLALAAATAAQQATAYDGDENHSRSRGWVGVV